MSVAIESGEKGAQCSWTSRDDSITTYCFGGVSEEERYRFEAHLIDCAYCWEEVRRLDSIIRSIQMERGLTRQFDPDIASVIGISARVPQAFFGHKAHCLLASTLYALALAVSPFMEIAYAYPRFATMAWTAVPFVFLGALLTTLAALGIDARLTRSNRQSGLALALAILMASAAVNQAIVGTRLPDYSITQASFHTWTAQAAYLKGIVYCGVFTGLFLFIPFHFVLVMQRSLWAGKHRLVYAILTGGRFGIPPRGVPYLGVWLLCALLILGITSSFLSTAHLLEGLAAGPYANLFILTIVVRWLLFLFLGIECCWWYYLTLNDLKRESALAGAGTG